MMKLTCYLEYLMHLLGFVRTSSLSEQESLKIVLTV